jgi:hypothetical protein
MRYRVTLAPAEPGSDSAVHVIDVINPDRLRAEQKAQQIPGLGDVTKFPMTLTTLWCWAACKRLGLTNAEAVAFLNEVCLDVGKADPEGAPGPTEGRTESP